MSANKNTFDLVAVVRCGKCRYYNPDECICTIRLGMDGEPLEILYDGFCSDGKEKI